LGILSVWDPSGPDRVGHLSGPKSVRALAFSPDGKALAAGGEDGEVRLLDWPTGKERRRFANLPVGVESLAFAPDGATLAAATLGSLRLWDVRTGNVLWKNEANTSRVVFSPDGKTLATAGSEANLIVLRDAATGKETRRLVPLVTDGHYGSVSAL